MGQTLKTISYKIGYEDVQNILQQPFSFVIITTLNDQKCILPNTISISEEERKINEMIQSSKYKPILIYGENCNDDRVFTKREQLIALGFHTVYIYVGGMFEWLLLQDIYGDEYFRTIGKEKDILKYKPAKQFHQIEMKMIEN
jgi:hypothetical protein